LVHHQAPDSTFWEHACLQCCHFAHSQQAMASNLRSVKKSLDKSINFFDLNVSCPA